MVVKEIVVERGNYPPLRHTEELALISCSRSPRFLLFHRFALEYHVVCQHLTYMASAPVARECTVSGLESVLAFLSEVPFVPHASKPPGFVSLQKLCQRRTPYALSHSTCQLPVPTHTHSTRQLPVCRTPYALSHRTRKLPVARRMLTHIAHASFHSQLTHIVHASFPSHAVCSHAQHMPASRPNSHT